MMKQVRSVIFNWFTTERGEEYCCAEVGKQDVIDIRYHFPQGEGDKHYCTIHYKNGDESIIFNLNRVNFSEEANHENHSGRRNE